VVFSEPCRRPQVCTPSTKISEHAPEETVIFTTADAKLKECDFVNNVGPCRFYRYTTVSRRLVDDYFVGKNKLIDSPVDVEGVESLIAIGEEIADMMSTESCAEGDIFAVIRRFLGELCVLNPAIVCTLLQQYAEVETTDRGYVRGVKPTQAVRLRRYASEREGDF
jgi:hypothetical protein